MADDRIIDCVALLLAAADRAGMQVTGDQRVSEQDAAALLGLHPGSLKNLRTEGAGPVAYRAGSTGRAGPTVCRTWRSGWKRAGTSIQRHRTSSNGMDSFPATAHTGL